MKKLYVRNKELEDFFHNQKAVAALKSNSQESNSEFNNNPLIQQDSEPCVDKTTTSPTIDPPPKDHCNDIANNQASVAAENAVDVEDMDESSFMKLDDSIFMDFREREEKLEDEIRKKDELIKKLQEENHQAAIQAKKVAEGETATDTYTRFIEKRLEECQEENRRYHAKYVDMREFSYSSVEQLMRQLNARKRNVIQNSNMSVYKQLFEKERKHWLDEKLKHEQAKDEMQ